ncbi:hypothetical protein AB1Y20_020992 [Prymnesium parvum]|uniref:Fe2OG dioxygenase domain-containing protein n=1 Tax=Prymnesium parvum TaxID=97485 RepID=A0AB34JH41_PRYPA
MRFPVLVVRSILPPQPSPTAAAMGKRSEHKHTADPSRRTEAAAAAKLRTGATTKSASTPWQQHLLSAALLLVAIAASFSLSPRGPPPPAVDPPGSDRSRAVLPREQPPVKTESAECAGWARDGECENNAPFMRQHCPSSCARGGGRSPAQQPAKKKKKKSADTYAECRSWASVGECESNPAFMLKECASACAGEAEDEVEDIHQDCAAWVKDGECYRNPAFMLQQCRKSCSEFARHNDAILQDTSDTCVNFALTGGCETNAKKASTECRASCHIQRICGNHTETVVCSKALRCEALMDKDAACEQRAKAGECHAQAPHMLKNCLKSCSEQDVAGLMRFHLPHKRTILSPLIDLPGPQPRRAGFYATPPGKRNDEVDALQLCAPHAAGSFGARLAALRGRALERLAWRRHHWAAWKLAAPANKRQTPRVPHLFTQHADEPHSSRVVTVQHVAFSPRIRYLHRLLSKEECEHVIQLASPLFSRSPVRGSVTRVRTSTTAMLGGSRDGAVVSRIRQRIARFSGYPVDHIEPLQVVRYEQGQKYEGHHDFFDVCDLEDKVSSGRRRVQMEYASDGDRGVPRRSKVTFLIYLNDMPEGETGGGTGFPELNIEVAPQQGSAIAFNDCFDNGHEDGRSLHQAQPPVLPGTVKMAINAWIRSHPVYHAMSASF